MKIKDKRALKYLPILIFLIFLIAFLNLIKSVAPNPYYEDQVEAAKKMSALSEGIKNYKIGLGLPIYDYDIFQTGLLGDEYNDTTTSLGNLEAKRTGSNPDMAALVVRMFHEVGLKEGDRVAAGFSGSFPGLNLAVMSAAEVMDLDLIIVSSMGASTYGANQRELTFPKMLAFLHSDGLTKYNSSMVTAGGDDDVATDIEDYIKEPIFDEYRSLGLDVVIEPNYEENIKKKVDLYYSEGDVDCYIAVGGNISFLGLEEDDLRSQGIIKKSSIRQETYDVDDGLISYFLSKNVPTIHLLNIRKIVTDYGMPYDPVSLDDVGTGSIYYTQGYNKPLIVTSLVILSAAIYFINKGNIRHV